MRPVALIFVEDNVEIRSTIAHHLMRGFRAILFFVPHGIPHPAAFAPQAGSIRYHTLSEEGVDRAINRVIRRVPNTWMYYVIAQNIFSIRSAKAAASASF